MSSFILLMMVAAFALKAVIPAGFMPEAKGGFIEMVICSGMGEKTVLIPNSEMPPSGHHDDTAAKESCAYQVLASGKILLPSAIVTLLEPQSAALSAYVENDSVAVSADRLSFEARGPPSV